MLGDVPAVEDDTVVNDDAHSDATWLLCGVCEEGGCPRERPWEQSKRKVPQVGSEHTPQSRFNGTTASGLKHTRNEPAAP